MLESLIMNLFDSERLIIDTVQKVMQGKTQFHYSTLHSIPCILSKDKKDSSIASDVCSLETYFEVYLLCSVVHLHKMPHLTYANVIYMNEKILDHEHLHCHLYI